MVFIKYFTAFLILAAFVNVQAQFDGPSRVQAEIVSEVTSIQPGSSFRAAITLKMDRGWHIYWSNPGDTGLQTSIEWRLPEGFTVKSLEWPYPERIAEEHLVVYGWHGTKTFLAEIYADESVQSGKSVIISADVSWLVCADVCMPGDETVQIELPVKNSPAQSNTGLLEFFAAAAVELPIKNSGWKFSAAVKNNELKIHAAVPEWFKGDLKDIYFFPDQTGFIRYNGSQTLQMSGTSYVLTIPLEETDLTLSDTLTGVLFSESGWRGPGSEKAAEISVVISNDIADNSGLGSIWFAILFSFLGGIILNLMPCVLPVLSIKIMGFIKQAHDEHIAPWKHGVSFTFGVLASFLALAGLLLVLKAGGEQLGWGFQLQSPSFLIVLSVFMFLFGLSLLGVFEIGTSMTTVGGGAQKLQGLTSSFVSGILATIVATPCTAPFMGSALGYALSQPVWAALVVFFFLGLGMAFPFLIISSIPALLKYVPKPGRWMQSLEQFMGFLLAATVVWLLWVLGIQTGTNALIIVLLNLLIVSLAAWIYGRWGNLAMPKRTRSIAIILTAVLIFGSTGWVIANIDKYAVSAAQAEMTDGGIDWQEFSEEKLQGLLAENRAVFIDFTAAWCLSCQVNEQTAFTSDEVQQEFINLNITALKADWTKRDARIAQALAKYGRNSVPLYVLYDGRNPEPQILPEIITPGIVLDALKVLK